MPIGREVGLSPGHIVLDGDSLPLPQRGTAPNFRPMSIVAKRSPISALFTFAKFATYSASRGLGRSYSPLQEEVHFPLEMARFGEF